MALLTGRWCGWRMERQTAWQTAWQTACQWAVLMVPLKP